MVTFDVTVPGDAGASRFTRWDNLPAFSDGYAAASEAIRMTRTQSSPEHELTPVLRALRAYGLDIVAIHHHMTGVQPMVVFLYYYGKGEAATLARGVRAAGT